MAKRPTSRSAYDTGEHETAMNTTLDAAFDLTHWQYDHASGLVTKHQKSGKHEVVSFILQTVARTREKNGETMTYGFQTGGMGGDSYGYGYDSIGNRVWSAENAATNLYAANALSQYTNVTGGAAVSPAYDPDGNLTGCTLPDGVWRFFWDAENRLAAAERLTFDAAGFRIRVRNVYDHRSRRVAKQLQRRYYREDGGMLPDEIRWGFPAVSARHIYDGWNIAAETAVDAVAGTTNAAFYTWGPDLSGTLQGAGGVDGLLAETKVSSTSTNTFFACCDANGNVTEYVDGTGTVCGRYGYSPFGEIAAQSGDMADAFTHRFSTKPFDAETGLAVYQLRPYNPPLGRWITRDPIEEQDGLNLYVVVGNDLVNRWDVLGLVEGKYILRNVSNVELSIVQSALAYAPEQLDGFEIEYVPEKTCQCAKDNIRLVQALKIGWLGSPAIDTFPEVYKRHTNTPGGIPLPGYTQSGGRAGNHGALSYIDAPFDAMGDVFGGTDFNFETCALCSDETNLGCVTFSFNGKKRKIVPSSGSEVEAKRPTRLWRTAVKTWLKASGRKP